MRRFFTRFTRSKQQSPSARHYEASYASKEGINAFDSLSFFNRLKSIDDKGDKIGEVGERLIDKFQSPAAKAVLNYAENFQKAFLKDYEIAYKLTNPAARESSTSILGTDLTRRGVLMAARMGWEWMRRNIGYIPFLRGFNENTQTHAFRYHLDKALREANGLEDFKHILERRVKKAHFNNETMRKYNEFISNVDEAVKNADELAKMSDDELAQMDKSLGRGTPQPNSNESVTQQSLNKAEIKPKNSAETKLLNEIDPSSLNDEQKAVFEVLTGQKDKIILQGKNLNDLYILERGTRQGGARKIITKHGGVEKTGGLSNDEILDMMKVVRDGELDENSFTQHKDFIRYAYDLKDENGLNLRLVVNEYNDGKKVFDFYSNRNFTDYGETSWQKNENIQMPQKQSQGENKQQVREFYSQINALRKEQKDKIAQAKNEFDTADKEMTPARYKSNLINTIKNEVKKIDDELDFDHSAYHTTKNDLRVGKNGVAKMVKVKRVAFSFNDLAHARRSIDLMKENLTNDEFKEARQYFQRVIDKVEPLLKSVDDIESAKANLAQDLDTKISTIKKEYNEKITRLKESFANTPQEIKDERTRAIITNLKTNAKEFSYIDKDALAKAELEGYGEVISDERLARYLRRLSALREQIEQGTNTTPLKEFGTNYAEFYRDGQGAVKKLLAEKQGQVAGAFYRDDLAKATGTGEIDLVWGNDEIGLKKIIDKHLSDFADFKGDTAQDKLANALGEIVKDGKVHFANNIPTIYHKKGDEWYLVGLSKGFNGTGDNLWVITSYKKTTGKIPDEILSGDTLNLSAYKGEFNPPLTSGDEPLNNKIIPNLKWQSQIDLDNLENKSLDELRKIQKIIDENEYYPLVRALREIDDEIYKVLGQIQEKYQDTYTKGVKEIGNAIYDFIARDNPNDELIQRYLALQKKRYHIELARNDYTVRIHKLFEKITPLQNAQDKIKYLKQLYKKKQFSDDDIVSVAREQVGEKAANLSDEFARENLKRYRGEIEKLLNINPLKEFGTNYAEFYRDGQGAVKKLLAEKQGQVAGAFYRQDLGDIDLIWGKSSGANDKGAYGLAHIIDKHGDEFAKFGGETRDEQISNALSEIIAKGKILPHGTDKINIEYNGFLIGLNKGFYENGVRSGENRWVVTAYDDNLTKAEKTAKSAPADDFTSEPRLSQNSNETLPQNELKSQVLSAYDKNVLENAPKETIEAHLKSIEKDIDYLEKGIDFYKKHPEQDYNGEMVKFNKKLLTPKLQMQKAYKQRLDELNSLDLSYAPKRSADEIQITLPKEKQTRFTMRQNAYKSLKEVEKTPLTNANDGRVAYLNKTGRQESLSDYAINESAKNSFDETQHLATAQHLPELFENAKFKETTKDLKNNDKNVKIHRYTANFLLDNEPAQAQITLKETIAGQHSGNKIYTLKLESVSRLSPAEPQNPREALRTINDPKSSGFGEPSAKSSETLPQNTTKSQVDFNSKVKADMLKIIQKQNPAKDDYHTWIRTIDDIKAFKEVLNDEAIFTPDYKNKWH